MKTERLSESEFLSRLFGRLVILALSIPVAGGLAYLIGLRGESLIFSALVLVAIIAAGWLLWERTRLPFEEVADEVGLFGQRLIVRRNRSVEKIRLCDILCVETLRVSMSVQAYLCLRNPEAPSRRIRFAPRSAGRLHPYAGFACIERLDRAIAATDREMRMSADALDRDIPENALALRRGTLLSNPDGEAGSLRFQLLQASALTLILVLAVLAYPRQMPTGPAIVMVLLTASMYLVCRNRVATGRLCAKEVHLRDDTLFVQHPNGADKIDLRDVIGYEIHYRRRSSSGRGGTPVPYRPLLDMAGPSGVLELRLARRYAFGDRLRFCPEPRLYGIFGDLGGPVVAMARLAGRARRI